MPQTRSHQFQALQSIYEAMDATTVLEAEDDILAEQDAAEAFGNGGRTKYQEGFDGYEDYDGITQHDVQQGSDMEMSNGRDRDGDAMEIDVPPTSPKEGTQVPPGFDAPAPSNVPLFPDVPIPSKTSAVSDKRTAGTTAISKVVNENMKGASDETTASYERCDSIALDTGEAKPVEEERSSFSHAQKMRAAATYSFGYVNGLGTRQWQRSDLTGKMAGNPSASEKVSMYMVSLRQRKVQAGEEATSARAITVDMIRLMYNYNRKPENWNIKPSEQRHRATANPDEWGGPKFRRLLLLAYNIAFLCLLRVDEVLNIRMEDIRLTTGEDGQRMLKLTLPFRKTNQFGNVKPFFLRELPEELKHLCPVRAFAEWINTTKIKKGYLFPKLTKTDCLHLNDAPMTSQQFLEGFRNNLIDISIDPAPYGTHSFRRGGCQWLSVYLCWSL
ncbi:hypothetical protein V5O48_017503 [Marasmius crinis-equi]|uniref:DNA breaking-rejoining enzyme n=1 Tax=Marasmius crinis-equi TaxID=585013 RepID=A0ABR3ENV6_9AGAR